MCPNQFFLKKNDSSLKKKEKKEIDLDYLITEFIGIQKGFFQILIY